jgi:hypothetical protein
MKRARSIANASDRAEVVAPALYVRCMNGAVVVKARRAHQSVGTGTKVVWPESMQEYVESDRDGSRALLAR